MGVKVDLGTQLLRPVGHLPSGDWNWVMGEAGRSQFPTQTTWLKWLLPYSKDFSAVRTQSTQNAGFALVSPRRAHGP